MNELNEQIGTPMVSKLPDADMQAVPAALLRAAHRAREVARQTHTAVVVMREGRLVEESAVPEMSLRIAG